MTLFTDLQASAAARLARFPQFQGIQILTERAKDFRSDVERALGGIHPDFKAGLFLLVGTPTCGVVNRQSPGPHLKIIVAVTCSENIFQNSGPNGSGIAAADCALDVLRALSGFAPSTWTGPADARTAQAMGTLTVEEPGIRVVTDPFDPDRLCYLATLATQAATTPLRLDGEGTYVKET